MTIYSLFLSAAQNTTADGLFKDAARILTSVYDSIGSIFTLVCVVILVICLIGMMVSKNGKTVEEFRAWRNRVIISWVIFNCLGSFIKYGQEITKGLSWNASNP